MIRDKKGQGLSMNTIVIIILAVLVLLVIIVIFTGGAAELSQKIQEFFSTGRANYDRTYVVNTCSNYCDTAKSLDDPAHSSYCTFIFRKVDSDGNGKPDGDYVCDSGNTIVDVTEKGISSGSFFDCSIDCNA